MENSYTHFALSKINNKIVNGWDYEGYDNSELRQFKKDYFLVDLIDYDINPKDVTILTKAALVRRGIDPMDSSNWANSVDECVENVKLTENDLRRIVKESVKNIMVESINDYKESAKNAYDAFMDWVYSHEDELGYVEFYNGQFVQSSNGVPMWQGKFAMEEDAYEIFVEMLEDYIDDECSEEYRNFDVEEWPKAVNDNDYDGVLVTIGIN